MRARAARRGPLLAVCGCCGGAGASTLALLVALAYARGHSGPVLVCDTGGPSGGLAAIAGVSTPSSLSELAGLVQGGLPTGPMFVTTSDGLRVLATTPRFDHAACARDGLQRLLDQAREAHALTVIDAGTLASESDRVALEHASHVAWVLPATRAGVRRAAGVLDALDAPPGTREVIVATSDPRERRGPVREVKRLALQRGAPLVLVPGLPDCAPGDPAKALSVAAVALQAIVGLLHR